MKLSKYQETIRNEVVNGNDNLIIEAVAGSGKTTTLLMVMREIVGRSIFVVFNKSIQEELSQKVPKDIKVSTLHSLGLSLLSKHIGRPNIDARKLDLIMDDIAPLELYAGMRGVERAEVYKKRRMIKNIIGLCKNTLIDYTDKTAIAEMADYYGKEFNVDIHSHLVNVMEKSIEQVQTIDFDDMIYLPVKLKLQDNYDFVLVDECQDLNRCQMELVLNIVAKNGRVIAVGDSKQSIYGFRGADTNAMTRMKEALKAKELPLSICYRCPKSHIDLASGIVPYIESSPSAEQGEIIEIDKKDFVGTVVDCDDILILSRLNSILVNYALSMISKGYKAIIKGREIGRNLANLVRNLKADSLDSLDLLLDDYLARERKKLENRNATIASIEILEDKVITIKEIVNGCQSVNDVIYTIENLFSDDKTEFTFSSVHKAKGLEAQNVFILKPDTLPLIRKKMKNWEIEQERNIQYVAYTRSKNRLYFVKDEK